MGQVIALAFLLVLAHVSAVIAAPAFVQYQAATGASGATATTSAFSSNTTVGNVVIITLDDEFSTSTYGYTHTCSDSKGNSYTKVHDKADYAIPPAGSTEVWWAPITTGGSSHTVSCSQTGGGYIGIVAMEFSGIESTPFDQVSAQKGNAPWTSGTVTTTAADELLIGFIGYVSVGTTTSDSPWVDVAVQSGGGTFSNRTAYRIVSSTGTYAYTGTTTGTEVRAVIATFEGTSGGGPAPSTPRGLLLGVGR